MYNLSHWANGRVTRGNDSSRSKLPIFRLKYQRVFAIGNTSTLLYILHVVFITQNKFPKSAAHIYSYSQKDCGGHWFLLTSR